MPRQTDIIDAAFKRLELLLTEVEQFADLNAEMQTSPLLGLRILHAVKNAAIRHGETKSDYISKTDLFGYVCAMGFERRAVALWLDALLKRALLFNYDPTCVDEQNATQLEISATGELHLHWGQREFEYLFAVGRAARASATRGLHAAAIDGRNRI